MLESSWPKEDNGNYQHEKVPRRNEQACSKVSMYVAKWAFLILSEYILRLVTQNSKLGKLGRIHGNPVADGWTEAVEQKPLAIQKCYGPTDWRTDRNGKL